MGSLRHVDVDVTDPYQGGMQRGRQVHEQLRRTWPIYQELFAVAARDAGRNPVDVKATAEACLDSVAAWAPDLAQEVEGVAAGAELDVRVVMALNARTEILAHAGATGTAECSTVAQLTEPVISAQTWDWHEELADGWHVQTVRGDKHDFVGLTEYGLLAKIGVNSAGLGVHFNILGHHSDVVPDGGNGLAEVRGGVPVHLVARRVLGRAANIAEATEIIGSAPACASTVITVVTADAAVSMEISPAGSGVVRGYDGWLVHTNHFHDPELATGERGGLLRPRTYAREQLLRTRTKAVETRLDVDGLFDMLSAHEEEGAAVCCHPDKGAPMGERRATLATVGIDPGRREVQVMRGGPCRRTEVTRLST